MIKNARQYGLARAQVERLRSALDEIASRPDDGWRDLEVAAVQSQVDELEFELADYDGLKEGTVDVGAARAIDDLPRLLIRRRIALGLTQRELADRLSLKEQQIQRYESEDWATASLRRVAEAATALELKIGEATTPDVGVTGPMTQALNERGIGSGFLRRRLRPTTGDDLADVVDLTARLNRIYGWKPSDVLLGSIDEPEPLLAAASSFKLPKRFNDVATRAYIVYSQYLALLTIDATASLEQRPIPRKPNAMRDLIMELHGRVDFAAVLDTAWYLGVPVLPLADPGAFHAVLWRTANRNVVVLKQQNRSASRWAFDLLHELRHATDAAEEADFAVIESEEADPNEKREVAANRFAGEVLLDGRAEEIAVAAVERAEGAVERLKGVVPDVADENGVAAADLANYLAHRMSRQGLDWWGAAHNLQDAGTDPWAIARQRFLANCDVSRLAPLDGDLLLQALADVEA